MKVEQIQWEIQNEKNKIKVRWVLVTIIIFYLAYLLKSGQGQEISSSKLFNWSFIGGIGGVIVLVNIIFMIYLARISNAKGNLSPAFKYITTFLDLFAVSALLLPTGGNESYFFLVYLIVIISNGMRYGMKLALFSVFAFNILYVLVLISQFWPNLQIPGLQKEMLKISTIWLVSLYVGYLSRRFELLQGEVEKYQKLVERMMEQKKS